jgi:hypothetical protein
VIYDRDPTPTIGTGAFSAPSFTNYPGNVEHKYSRKRINGKRINGNGGKVAKILMPD